MLFNKSSPGRLHCRSGDGPNVNLFPLVCGGTEFHRLWEPSPDGEYRTRHLVVSLLDSVLSQKSWKGRLGFDEVNFADIRNQTVRRRDLVFGMAVRIDGELFVSDFLNCFADDLWAANIE